MKQIIIAGMLIALVTSCRQVSKESAIDEKRQIEVPVVLPKSLENRRNELETYVLNAMDNIDSFRGANQWNLHAKEPFMDSVMIFDEKKDFDHQLLLLAGMDTTTQLPETYCGALEKGILVVVAPEIYSRVYLEGIETDSYVKLLTHEIAHRLHIRILNGNEEAMGPVWFYEGFAIFVANQFGKSDLILSRDEMVAIINDPERGGYVKYGFVFRHVVNRIPLQELIERAGKDDFNQWVISKLD